MTIVTSGGNSLWKFQILSFFLNGYGTSPQGLGQGLVFHSAAGVSAPTGHSSIHRGCK